MCRCLFTVFIVLGAATTSVQESEDRKVVSIAMVDTPHAGARADNNWKLASVCEVGSWGCGNFILRHTSSLHASRKLRLMGVDDVHLDPNKASKLNLKLTNCLSCHNLRTPCNTQNSLR